MTLQPQQTVAQKFIVISIEQKKTKTGKDYLQLQLADPTGIYEAKVWQEQLNAVNVKRNQVAWIEGQTQAYQNTISIVVTSGYVLEDESTAPLLPQAATPTVIFDIETVGQPFSELDPSQQSYLLDTLEKGTTDPEVAKQRTALYPLFGIVAYIGMINPFSQKGTVLGIHSEPLVPEDDQFEYIACANEATLLASFWQQLEQFDRFVTYNGHNFDFPFLAFRSAVQRVQIPFPIEEAHGYRNSDRFIDLQTAFRVGNRPYKLEMLTKALGIANPKSAGVSGLHVSDLYRAGNHQAIVDYVARDAVATMELFNRWREFVAGRLIL